MTVAPESPIRVAPQWPRSAPCRLAFVGEAPGDSEIAYRVNGVLMPTPLVGPSGIAFNQLLRSANIDRGECGVTNLFDQKAIDNDVGPWMRDKTTFMSARQRLWQELARMDPAVVVTMGGPATFALTGQEELAVVRGVPQYSAPIMVGRDRWKIVPTYHPAYVQRVWKMFSTVVADLVKASALADKPRGSRIEYDKAELWVAPTSTDLWAFKERYLDPAEIITIDIETATKARQITCVGFGSDNEHALCVPFVDWRKPNRCYWQTPEDEVAAWRFVAAVCDMPQPKLMQNGTFDTFWLYDRMRIAVRNYSEDTRLLHHALYPELPKDLAYLAACYTNSGPWKTMRAHKAAKREE